MDLFHVKLSSDELIRWFGISEKKFSNFSVAVILKKLHQRDERERGESNGSGGNEKMDPTSTLDDVSHYTGGRV